MFQYFDEKCLITLDRLANYWSEPLSLDTKG